MQCQRLLNGTAGQTRMGILVYAHPEDSPWHDSAYASVVELAEGCAQ
jgi:hypothetical protein